MGTMLQELWAGLAIDTSSGSAEGEAAGEIDAVTTSGPERLLPSVYDVTGLATACVGAAGLAAAQLLATRNGETLRPVSVHRRAASLSLASEALFTPVGWELPPVWDPIAGVYECADGGFIRLHTNYAHHRAAAERALGLTGADVGRELVADAVRDRRAVELETAVVEAGGCAAALHGRDAWLASAAGAATASEPFLRADPRSLPPATPPPRWAGRADRPLTGVRVLDLTRVLAGPVCTRFLAAYGAEVLRIDPPGFAEVPALVPDVTAGKRTAFLDLRSPSGRESFLELVAGADVLVSGLRPGALPALGLAPSDLGDLNPGLVTATIGAYGWTGPWAGRRGFDSLVQMSCGIAAAGGAAQGTAKPVPLPVQALDHGTGYLLAAAIAHALERRLTDGVAVGLRASLVGTANLLMRHPTPNGLAAPRPEPVPEDTVPTTTAWGPARRVPLPVTIDGVPGDWRIDAGPLGAGPAAWAGRSIGR
jgi:crotonobetainyl-CoA:carnitine CoA-transferase CaiB-like acyl-CoA transferase